MRFSREQQRRRPTGHPPFRFEMMLDEGMEQRESEWSMGSPATANLTPSVIDGPRRLELMKHTEASRERVEDDRRPKMNHG